MFTEVKSTGLDGRKYSTGSVRDSEVGKGRQDLIPLEPLKRLAVHYENGAKKYGDRNWELGQEMAGHLRSAFRHLTEFMNGANDEDHLSACVWNIFSFIATEKWVIEGKLNDDKTIIDSLHPVIKDRIIQARYQRNLSLKSKELRSELKKKLDQANLNYAKMLDETKQEREKIDEMKETYKKDGNSFKGILPEIKIGDNVFVLEDADKHFTKRITFAPPMHKMKEKVFKVEDIQTLSISENILMYKLRADDGVSWWFTRESIQKVI